ncbi:MAG TPA: CpsD/CapB family tyrosine-protein kinase [Terriglobia bacterium]|nr:CpsD/CapB family tyrosine-protein kinase [Terriglobia bacterium]
MSLTNTLLDELRKLQENRESGVLVLSKQEQRVSISYREGVIQSASSNLDTHRLGAYLIREGYLSEPDVPKVIAEARRAKVVFGEAAVRKNLVDPAELAEMVRRQAIELLKHAFKNGFVKESYTRGLRSYYVPANINVAYILLEISRGNPAPFDPDPSTVFTLKKSEVLSGVPWLPKELGVLGELEHASTIAGLVNSTGIDESALKRILGVFDRLGIIDKVVGTTSDAETEDGETALIRKSVFPFERLVPVVSNAVLGEKLEVVRNPSSFISEQFKTLKVRIREDCETPPRVLIISSPDQQDGKSLVSANLALTLSMEPGRRTIIVDCDLRNPTLNRHLGVAAEPGLIQYLSNGRMSPYCYSRRLGNLYFMTSGGIADNPIEMLSLQKMKDLIEHLRADFDTVIIDAPPLAPIADARIVTALSDGMILVIRRGKTSLNSIEAAFKVMDQRKLIGVVFNDVKPMLFNTYFSRGYYNYGIDSRYSYAGGRKIRNNSKNYLES